jgi:K+-sensing histidine kinase KdpD
VSDAFLQFLRASRRGWLKIYLGMAAGVGKTFAMLREGKRLRAEGVDVVCGIVETHGRSETAAEVAGVELLPRRTIDYRGVPLEEMDLDAVLARRPLVALEVIKGDSPGLVSVDPERISIALANLVANAMRHTPPGGTVTLDATKEGSLLRVRVKATGEGIAAEDLPRIFEGAPGAGPGSLPEGRARHGLGLAIAREIVLQHGGELRAESAPGAGSVFTMILPFG